MTPATAFLTILGAMMVALYAMPYAGILGGLIVLSVPALFLWIAVRAARTLR